MSGVWCAQVELGDRLLFYHSASATTNKAIRIGRAWVQPLSRLVRKAFQTAVAFPDVFLALSRAILEILTLV